MSKEKLDALKRIFIITFVGVSIIFAVYKIGIISLTSKPKLDVAEKPVLLPKDKSVSMVENGMLYTFKTYEFNGMNVTKFETLSIEKYVYKPSPDTIYSEKFIIDGNHDSVRFLIMGSFR